MAHPAADWAGSGMQDLTGPADGPGLGPPSRLVAALHRVGEDIARHSAALGREVRIDPLAVLAERAAAAGLRRRGAESCGGGTRLVRTRAGWLAVCLARPDDEALVPAWLAAHVDPLVTEADPWAAIDAACRAATAADLAAQAIELGLPVAALGERPTTSGPELGGVRLRRVGSDRETGAGGGAVIASGAVRVVDLSSLWAGPLCGALLAAAGARVTKVESVARPDAARSGPPGFFERLNGAKEQVELDFATTAGLARLHDVVAAADVVIEGSRPRALLQLGLDADDLLAAPAGPRLWISITGYGRAEGNRVAFGDVAAAAGGLVAWHHGAPLFCGDAIADPLSGLAAAAAALEALANGTRGLLDVSMADVAASVADVDAR
ncbi:MAG: hypothetical protein JWM89_2572 [Acidimicrobiales bacterium]|nr:hypothetical protein [Acidimicrobiales bacterium]